MNDSVRQLHYYKCLDCLEVMTTEKYLYEQPCVFCGGRLSYMGQVERERVVETQFLTPCDDRCTGAQGPKCNCHCGGANHGSNLIIKVERDRGAAQEMNPVTTERCKAAKARVAEFCEIKQLFLAAYSKKFGEIERRKKNREWLSNEDFSKMLEGGRIKRLYDHICLAKIHKNRMAKMAKLAADLMDGKI